MDNMQPVMTETCWGKSWRNLHDKLHRTDGPAVEHDSGSKLWYLHDKLHRTDGPAAEYADGSKVWYLHGKRLTFEDWLEQTDGLTNEEKVMHKLAHG
jgi:hypothetical protein